MRNKKQEISFGKYIDNREGQLFKLLGNQMETELEQIHYLEKTRGLMYKSISDKLNDRLNLLRSFTRSDVITEVEEVINNAYEEVILDGWSCEYTNHRIKIYANDFPARLYWKRISSDIDYLNTKLERNISKILRKLYKDYPLKWNGMFVWIKFFMPLKNYDIDNSYYKPIIDGIVSSGLVEDDDFSHMSFGFNGCCDKENPHMEIYIYEKGKVDFIEIQSL